MLRLLMARGADDVLSEAIQRVSESYPFRAGIADAAAKSDGSLFIHGVDEKQLTVHAEAHCHVCLETHPTSLGKSGPSCALTIAHR